ncbi:MAG: hypothetical protein ACK41P_00800 [Asticcacaulis sp.]
MICENVTFNHLNISNESIILDELNLYDCKVIESSNFSNSIFYRNVRFNSTHFNKKVLFYNICWPLHPFYSMNAFRDTTFDEIAYFTNSGLNNFQMFAEANFKSGARFDRELRHLQPIIKFKEQTTANTDLTNVKTTTVQLIHISESSKYAKADYEKSLSDYFNEISNNNPMNVFYQYLESGCRTLKHEFQKNSDFLYAQIMYKYELKSRKLQQKTPIGEKLTSSIYSYLSDYGLSVIRPVSCIIILFITFAIFYYTFNYSPIYYSINLLFPYTTENTTLNCNPISIADAFAVSASRIFPFGPFDDVNNSFVEKLMCQKRGWDIGLFRFLATLQSLFSIVLVFLFGLAVRRRFQVS